MPYTCTSTLNSFLTTFHIIGFYAEGLPNARQNAAQAATSSIQETQQSIAADEADLKAQQKDGKKNWPTNG